MIGNTLRLLRKIFGKSIKELSVELGISPSYISAIEHNKRNPSLDLLGRYSKVFDIRLNQLLFFHEEITDDEDIGFFERSSKPLVKKAITLLEKMITDERR